MAEQKIFTFYGGMADDPKIGNANQCGWSAGFDLGNTPQSLSPIVDLDRNTASYDPNYSIQKLTKVGSNIYGLGLALDGYSTIYKLANFPGGSATWSEDEVGPAEVNQSVFAYYHDYLYFVTASTYINKYGPISSSPTLTTHWKTISANVTCCPDTVIGTDDNLYIAYKKASTTGLARIDGTNLVEDVITIPADLTIRGLCMYGNYIAIAADDGFNGKVFLWDQISPDVSEVIDLGEGTVASIENLEGALVIFMEQSGSTTSPRDTYVRILTWSGGNPQVLKVIRGQWPTLRNVSFTTPAYNYKGQVYIGGLITGSASATNSEYIPSIFRLGRKNSGLPLSFSIEQYLAGQSNGTLSIKDLVFKEDNIVFIKDLGTSSVVAHGTLLPQDIYTTKTANTFINGVWESLIQNGGDASIKKQLNVVSVSYEPLPSGASVSLKYRLKDTDAWTTIFTDSVDDSQSHETNIIESTTSNLPTYKEIQFRLESVGGAEITGFKFKFTPLTNIYGN